MRVRSIAYDNLTVHNVYPMALIQLEQQDDDDRALLFRLQHIIGGAIRYARARHTHIVKIDNWFGSRWLWFAGNQKGKDLHSKERLAIPPFAPNRVVSEASYRRHGNKLRQISSRRLHESRKVSSASMPFYLDKRCSSGIFVWYSGRSANQDRAALMVYDIEKGGNQRGWYAELQKLDGVWSVSSAVGTSKNEIHKLETAYDDQLLPLFLAANDQLNDNDRFLWEQVLDVAYGPQVARASVLIDEYRSRHPDEFAIRLLHARNLGRRRLFEAAEEEFREIERLVSREKWRRRSTGLKRRCLWLYEWGQFNKIRGDLTAAEGAYREWTSLEPHNTAPWILLGGCLSRQGKLEEAEAIHRHATGLQGDPDEAYVNLGYVLRATGRFEEAASAFESALKIESDYPAATRALTDVRAAIELLKGRDT